MTPDLSVRRGFIELDDAHIHFRYAGQDSGRRPLVLIHASPSSSLGLINLIKAFSSDRRVIAPDTLGNGDSVADIPDNAPISYFAKHLASALEKLGLVKYDLYGTHTGASLATEMAIMYPKRIGAIVLDGVGLYTPQLQQELLERYAPEVKLDHQGTYLMWVWHFVRDTFMFWPWYRLDQESRRSIGVPTPRLLHNKVVEVLKAAETYHHSYRAAIGYNKRANIPRLMVPTMAACAHDDMLSVYFDELGALVPGGQKCWTNGANSPALAELTAEKLRLFFDSY